MGRGGRQQVATTAVTRASNVTTTGARLRIFDRFCSCTVHVYILIPMHSRANAFHVLVRLSAGALRRSRANDHLRKT